MVPLLVSSVPVADPGFPVGGGGGGGRQFTRANRADYNAHLSSFLPYFI